MKNFKRIGFTLSEVLITLSIVAVVATLVLPGFIKDMKMRANMALLQSTVVNLSDVVQQDLIRTRAKTLEDANVYNNPKLFLTKNFDYVKEGQNIFRSVNDNGEYVAYTFSHMIAPSVAGGSTTPTSQVLLKNGVYIGIYKSSMFRYFVVDLNGPEEPNIIGIDYFVLDIAPEDDLENGIRMGDVGAFQEYTAKESSELKTLCLNGSGQACYALVERSGFDPNYIDKF
ncbi:MAG: type II secretion system protein [Cyanobacteria bacterium SIG26]|nr:type II secretion system protein [Cyanobacteria bacterium SIG26]